VKTVASSFVFVVWIICYVACRSAANGRCSSIVCKSSSGGA